jgi:hypothetical protein
MRSVGFQLTRSFQPVAQKLSKLIAEMSTRNIKKGKGIMNRMCDNKIIEQVIQFDNVACQPVSLKWEHM